MKDNKSKIQQRSEAWSIYERMVFDEIKSKFHSAIVEYNAKVLGKYSKGERQCDVIIKEKFDGRIITTVVDAKYYSKKIDVKDVEMFIAMAKDIDADRGILVSPKGYSKLAYNRAENDESEIALDIMTLDEWGDFQSDVAMPYSGSIGVFLFSPLGWIIDGARHEGFVASSYRKGLSIEKAMNEKEFMYFNFWKKDSSTQDLRYLNKFQTDGIFEVDKSAEITLTEGEYSGKRYWLRKAIVNSYPAPEYTCAVDHGEFIFFGVLFSPENRQKVNLNKLLQCVCKTVPFKKVG